MSRIVAIGEAERVQGFALAGVDVVPAGQADGVRAAWEGLPADVALVVLTPAAHAALTAELGEREERLCVVMPV